MVDEVIKYFSTDAIHYSLLSKVASGYTVLKEYLDSKDSTEEKKKPWTFVRGSLVDMLITEPKKIDEYFYIADIIRPTTTLLKLADLTLEYMTKETIDKKEIAKLSDSMEFWKSTKDPEKRIAKFDLEEFWSYLKHMWLSKEKNLITTKEYDDATYLVALIKEHQFTRKYFNDTNNTILYQVPIYWEEEVDEKPVKFKALLDMVIIAHKSKKIYPIDLKTMSASVLQFKFNYRSFKYYLQGAFYTKALKKLINIQEDKTIKDYEIQDFRFLVMSNKDEYPLVYTMNKEELVLAETGNEENNIKGVPELINNWLWYDEHGLEYPRDVIEAKGELILDCLTN